VPSDRRGDAAHPVRSRARRGPDPRRLDGDQHLRRDPRGARARAGARHRHPALRLRHALPVEAVQSRLPARAQASRARVARDMTELLFRDDAYARTCEARVVGVDERGIRLDRTVFYAQGGGQPGDSGRLLLADGRSIAIADTRKGDGVDEILHLPAPGAAALAPGDVVVAEIDWERRYRLMRMHSALHLLCAVVPGAVTGGQVGDARSRLDFDVPGDALDKAPIARPCRAGSATRN